jgi:lipopolysaccharide export system protein LptC
MTHAAAHSFEPRRIGPAMTRWRRRSGLIKTLRWALPAGMALIALFLVGAVVLSGVKTAKPDIRAAQTAIRLVNARFMGRVKDGRGFQIGAINAMRDEKNLNVVILNEPNLTIGGETATPARLAARRGEYDEVRRLLTLIGDVRIDDGAGRRLQSERAVIDMKEGKIVGQSGISGDGPMGQFSAQSYDVNQKTKKLEFKGRVRARLNTK